MSARAPRPGRRGVPKHPLLWDRAWLASRLETGRTLASVAAEAGCSESAVRKAADAQGITRRRAPQHPSLRDPAWLRHHYVEQRRSTSAIGEALGVSGNTVSVALRRVGIPARAPGFNHRDSVTVPHDQIRAAYEAGLAGTAIARRFGISKNTVYRSLEQAGIRRRSRGEAFNRLVQDPAWLASRVQRGLTAATIAEEAHCSPNTVHLAIKRLGLRRRRVGSRDTSSPQGRGR